jgi:Domain of unknown function (DUF6438)
MPGTSSVNLKYTVCLFFILSILIYACTGSKNITAQANDFPGEPGDSLIAYIERTRCYGVCPYYSIKIYRSGYVLYEGYDNVPNTGRYHTRLLPEQLVSIGLKAEETGYFDLKDEYRNPYLTDFPTIYSEVRFRGKQKKITHYTAEPPSGLVEMEKYLDAMFPKETNWIKHPVQDLKD